MRLYLLKERHDIIWKWLTFIIALIYILNCFTPLRLHVDTLRYFAILDCIENGCPPESFAAQDYLPYGYTALLIGLSKTGILKSFTLVLFNCVFLFSSLYILVKLFKIEKTGWFLVALVLLNWTTIKFVLHPLSEMQYLFFSVSSLYFFNSFTASRKVVQLGAAFIFAALAFITRTVGITLVSALVVGILWEYRQHLLALIKKSKWVVIGSIFLVILIGLFSKQLGVYHYVDVLIKQFTEGVGYKDILRWHFIELAEISINLPFTKVLVFMPTTVRVIFLLIGIITLVALFALIVNNARQTPVVVISYLIFYFFLMFNWPFYDPRFWVPVVPLCIAILATTSFALTRFQRISIRTVSLSYVFFGLLSIGYFTYTSFNREVFATTQANGSYRNEYEIFFYGKPQEGKNLHADSVLIQVLERYK
jgi:hypothetical protein